MSDIIQDIKYGLRMLVKSPAFTIVAVLSLALGIGVNIVIFTMINAVKLRSLPVEKPDELYVFKWEGEEVKASADNNFISRLPNGYWTSDVFSYQNYCLFRDNITDVTEIMAMGTLWEPVYFKGQRCDTGRMIVSGNFFDGLGLNAVAGRTIKSDDDRPGADFVAVISHAFWKQYFNLAPDAIGQTVTINDTVFPIIGVLPEDFLGPNIGQQTDVYVPVSSQQQPGAVGIMARIEAGNQQKVQQQAETLFRRIIYPNETDDSQKALSLVFEDGGHGREKYTIYKVQPLRVAIPIMATVLLIVCVNLAGLLLVRGAARRHELSIREALGASRWRLLCQLLTETALLSCLGTGLGLLLASWSKTAIAKMIWINIAGYDLGNDALVLGFTLVLSLITLLIFGILPAFRSTKLNPLDSLREKIAIGRLHLRLGKILVIAQVALAFLLLTGAGLFIRTSFRLANEDKGFDTENLLTFVLDSASTGYEGESLTAFHDQAAAAIASLPGVEGLTRSQDFLVTGTGGAISWKEPNSGYMRYRVVGNSYFTIMGISLLQGRDFKASYDESESKSIIINELLARQLFGNEDPIGKPLPPMPEYRVIGVCHNFKIFDIRNELEPAAFFHYSRNTRIIPTCYAVRTTVQPETLIPAVRQAVAEIDSAVPINNIMSQEDRINSMFTRERRFAYIASGAALVAIFLSCLGLYGLQAYQVTHRTREIGVRIALGASRKQVLVNILRSSFFLGVFGVILGLPVVFAAIRIIRSYIWGISLYDPVNLVVSAIVILVVMVAAAYLPACRAARIDPIEALRYE